jgi:plastocyanin
MNEHAYLFESVTLENGDSFSYIIPDDSPEGTIHYHDHMFHDATGKLLVSSPHGQKGIIKVVVLEGEHAFNPNEVTIAPGATIEWTNQKTYKVRITSGKPPSSTESDHNDASHASVGSSEHEEVEKTLITIEVRP